ncbi:hypothetical protein BJ138DRAFT_1201984 [Hygrophoropsis aurantiaca]|uniref:Uncharacterized protein n=1 Tax=Hygrophoropsis aurantiaca TaxID=72124 RepID=A0ACB8ATB6_9AGAM|nr:hypothetical protein BJ138DRAFT_1201984 [Hygrophoropsis aurantiaca]
MVASPQPEKRLLWHPRWENKFVVGGGSQMSLYQWAPEHTEIRHITSQHDLQFMKCFAWSPDSAFDDLVAIGLASGRVDLMRLEATKSARNNVLSSGPVVSLPVRNSRSCNALAFCITDPNYLAVGLDKVRGDSSLVIWDIHSTTPTFSINKPASSAADDVVSRPQPLIARADIGPRTDGRVLQQHAPTEVVSALAFLPQSTHLLLAGISARWLRLFDLRSPSPTTTNIASKAQGIAISSIDPHQIACCGDGIVTLWDTRRLATPLLTFTEKDAAADGAHPRSGSTSVVNHIEFSSTRRGVLAVHDKESTYVRFWNLHQAQAPDGLDGGQSNDSPQSRAPRRSWTNLPWPATYNTRQNSSEPQELSALVLANTWKTKNFNRPLASFALVPSTHPFPLTSQVMVVNKDGDLELYAVHDTPKQASWSARGELTIGAGVSYKTIPGFHDTTPPPQPWDVSVTGGDEDSSVLGRQKANSLVPTFGRGDEEGFPALRGEPINSGGARPPKPRTYSPATLRNYTFEYSATRNNSPSQVGGPGDSDKKGNEDGRVKGVRNHVDTNTLKARNQPQKNVQHIVQGDISMTIRCRITLGYGLASAKHNAQVIQDEPSLDPALSDLWAWINYSQEFCAPTPRLHGYDFSHQGLLGIWDGFPPISQASDTGSAVNSLTEISASQTFTFESTQSTLSSAVLSNPTRSNGSSEDASHGDFRAAILHIISRQGAERLAWKPSAHTNKLERRQFALQLCGWSLKEEDLNVAIKRWEKEGKHSRAACWLVFTQQYSKALELLMRSKDETHQMMSGTLAALLPTNTSRNKELIEYSERLMVRLQDPYFRAMLVQLTSKDWSEVLEEEALPLRERLAIAFQFLEDSALSSYLRRVADRCSARGDIEGIIITGLTPPAIDIIQNYVDRTGDVQTAAILSSFVCPSKFEDGRAERWLEAYRDLLDGFRLFHHRVSFDIDRGHILQEAIQNGDLVPFEWAPRQILIRCNYCSKPVNPVPAGPAQKSRPAACPNCSRALPRCSICLMTLSIISDAIRDSELSHSQSDSKDTIDDAIVICQSCRHGGHASHILDWFFGEEGARSKGVCPVADCDCRCGDEF